MQQDAHEMFNYLINEIADTLTKQKKDISEKLHKNGLEQRKEVDPKGILLFFVTFQHSRLGFMNSFKAN
jgi:hypothetical protein